MLGDVLVSISGLLLEDHGEEWHDLIKDGGYHEDFVKTVAIPSSVAKLRLTVKSPGMYVQILSGAFEGAGGVFGPS